MKISLPKIIDAEAHIIETSDGFRTHLRDNIGLHRYNEGQGNINERYFRILTIKKKHYVIKIDAHADIDYQIYPDLLDVTGHYLFRHTENMFKFGATQGVTQWKDDLKKPWVEPQIVSLLSRYNQVRWITRINDDTYEVEGASHFFRRGDTFVDFEGGPFICCTQKMRELGVEDDRHIAEIKTLPTCENHVRISIKVR
jgi:hypothetical protein